MHILLLLSNLFFLIVWVRIWSPSGDDFHFNPLVSAPIRLTDRIFEFLRPVLVGFRTPAMATATLLFLVAFRGAIVCNMAGSWQLAIGSSYARGLPTGYWPGCMLFSLADFTLFMVRLWGLALLVALITPQPRRDRMEDAFLYYTLPVSLLPRTLMAMVVVVLNALLVLQLQHTGVPVQGGIGPELAYMDITFDWGEQPVASLLKFVWLTAMSLADILLAARSLMLALVLGSLGAAITQHRGLAQLCQEGIRLLLGGFGRRPIMVGLFDFTPLVYFIVTMMLYGMLIGILRPLIGRVP